MELRDDDRLDLGATGARPMLSCGGTDRFRLEAPPVGNLTDVRLWHDGSSDRPSWCARQPALARTGMALARTGMTRRIFTGDAGVRVRAGRGNLGTHIGVLWGTHIVAR